MDEAAAAWKAKCDDLKAKLARVEGRLRWHERALLRPEVLADLLPGRAENRRRAAPHADALERERTLAAVSPAYAEARTARPPEGADRVTIAGLTLVVPRDARREGRLADRVVRDHWLPLADLLRTREAIAAGVMLDVGANIGLTSIPRAILGDADVIYAAEPDPANFACLVRNVVDNGLTGTVLPDRVAISDRDGTARLKRSGSIGGHRLSEDPGADLSAGASAKVEAAAEAAGDVDVAVLTLDSWTARLKIDIDAIRYVKVDTQGRESHVLDGAPSLLAKAGVVWELEFSPEHLRLCGRAPEHLIQQMTAAFTHAIDLNPHAPGKRMRRAADLADALAYLDRSYTNLLLYRV